MHMSRVNKTYETTLDHYKCWKYNIITFLMATYLNGYFSSVFTRKYIHSLQFPDAKFQDAKPDYLGKLIVTPSMVAKKIKAMKDNKSPGWNSSKTTNGNSRNLGHHMQECTTYHYSLSQSLIFAEGKCVFALISNLLIALHSE